MLHDFIVIGAGASGLFFAARSTGGKSVLLLERQNRAGRKLLISGGGKCNVTNRNLGPENYHSRGSEQKLLRRFLAPALQAWPAGAMLDFLEEHGIDLEEREHGQMFCQRGAEELRDLLVDLAGRNGAQIKLGQNIQGVRPAPEGGGFEVISNGQSHFARRLLLASGGPAWPRAGGGSFGEAVARSFGHSIVPAGPALTPLSLPPDWPLHGLQGLSLEAGLSLPGSGAPCFTLPLLFTHKGLSGPACLQISGYLPASKPGEPGELEIDFLPGQDLSALLDEAANQRLNLAGLLRRLLPERLIAALLRGAKLENAATRKLAELPRAVRKQMVQAVQAHRCHPLAPSFDQAESSGGGVDLLEINPATLESRLTPGLHFCGELVDVCGWLGGYNLHWAWASANLLASLQSKQAEKKRP